MGQVTKRFRKRVGTERFFFSNLENRLGDEIQMTALLKWLKTRSIEISYKDENRYGISAKSMFPEGLTRFVDDNREKLPTFDPINLWIWAPMLRAAGIYTELTYAYNPIPKLDVVMAPLIGPDYNSDRAFGIDMTERLFRRILDDYPNSYLVVDARKKAFFAGSAIPNLIFSGCYGDTFDMICCSRVFIGGDTGMSHYAGAVNHPRMLLFYPDNSRHREAYKDKARSMADRFAAPSLLPYSYDSTPCCNPKNLTILGLQDGKVDIDEAVARIKVTSRCA